VVFTVLYSTVVEDRAAHFESRINAIVDLSALKIIRW